MARLVGWFNSLVKQLKCVLVTMGVFCVLTGCQDAALPRPDFPLAEETVLAAMEQTGLPGSISEEETRSGAEGHISYTLREQAESGMMTAVSSALKDEKRFLQVIYTGPRVPRDTAFSWEDWKQRLVFPALLSGGFADQEELYNALVVQEVQEGNQEWFADLPAGYCRVLYREATGAVTASPERRPLFSVTIYESKEHYKEIQEEAAANREAMERTAAGAEN